MKWLKPIADLWSTTRFTAHDLSAYAERLMLDETRRGVMTMGLVFLALLLGSSLIHDELGLGQSYVYTSLALAALSLHVVFSARAIREIRTLHVLGMTMLIISGTAFVLHAHQTGAFGAALFTSVALLFMVVPMVPWGLREASLVTFLLYGVLSSSTWSVAHRFDPETLWTLQAFMLASAMVSVTLVGRGARVRKEDIRSRFDLEKARAEMERLSYRDPLTNAWNRRFLESEFAGFMERARKTGGRVYFAILDVDEFKQFNDSFGHAHGDQVLQWVSHAFRTHVGDAGHFVRAGGDEFVLLFETEAPEELIEAALSSVRACAAAERPGAAAEISLSVGLAELPSAGSVCLDDACLVADGALYRAKQSRGGNPTSSRIVRVALASDGSASGPEGR